MSEKRPIDIWSEKLDYFRKQEAIAADPNQKFELQKRIEEAKAKIAELESEERKSGRSISVPLSVPAPLEHSASRLLQKPSPFPPTAKELKQIFGMLKIVPVEELGGDQEQTMDWHRINIWREDTKWRNSLRRISLNPPLPPPSPSKGLLTRDELSDVISSLEERAKKYAKEVEIRPEGHPELSLFRSRERDAQREVDQARTLLRNMEAAGVDAVDYMPAQLQGLPRHLIECAIDILLNLRSIRASPFLKVTPFEITQEDLNRYRKEPMEPTRYGEIQEIAHYLRFRV